MNKKYIYLLLILIIVAFSTTTTTTNASFLSLKQRINDILQENSTFQKITDIISNISSYDSKVESILAINITDIIKGNVSENNESIFYEKIGNNTALGRIIEIITLRNEKFANILQRVIQNVRVISSYVNYF